VGADLDDAALVEDDDAVRLQDGEGARTAGGSGAPAAGCEARGPPFREGLMPYNAMMPLASRQKTASGRTRRRRCLIATVARARARPTPDIDKPP